MGEEILAEGVGLRTHSNKRYDARPGSCELPGRNCFCITHFAAKGCENFWWRRIPVHAALVRYEDEVGARLTVIHAREIARCIPFGLRKWCMSLSQELPSHLDLQMGCKRSRSGAIVSILGISTVRALGPVVVKSQELLSSAAPSVTKSTSCGSFYRLARHA